MIVVLATVIGMASATLRGGRLRRLAQVELRKVWLIWVTIIVQTVIFELPSTIVSDQAYALVHIGTYVSAFVFLWLNRHIPGALIIGAGAAANAAAITANGGVMPASPSAWETAGLPAELGAERERERAREIRQGTHNDTETEHNTINLNNKTTQSISNTKQLELGVAELASERERTRKIRQGTHNDTESRHDTINLNNITIQSIPTNTKQLELGVAELGAKRERAREIRRGTDNHTETRRNTINQNNITIQSISANTKQLELGVAELGAERERIRAQAQSKD